MNEERKLAIIIVILVVVTTTELFAIIGLFEIDMRLNQKIFWQEQSACQTYGTQLHADTGEFLTCLTPLNQTFRITRSGQPLLTDNIEMPPQEIPGIVNITPMLNGNLTIQEKMYNIPTIK